MNVTKTIRALKVHKYNINNQRVTLYRGCLTVTDVRSEAVQSAQNQIVTGILIWSPSKPCTKTINGDTIIISPMFNGGCEPIYWEVSINDRVAWRTFASAKEANQYVESLYRRRSEGVGSSGLFAPFLTDV